MLVQAMFSPTSAGANEPPSRRKALGVSATASGSELVDHLTTCTIGVAYSGDLRRKGIIKEYETVSVATQVSFPRRVDFSFIIVAIYYSTSNWLCTFG